MECFAMELKRTILSAVTAVLVSAATIVSASAQPATSSVNGDWLNSGGGEVPYYGYVGGATSHRRYHAYGYGLYAYYGDYRPYWHRMVPTIPPNH
jgi:hypothetical protein